MQGNVRGQSGGGLDIQGIIQEYKVASGGNINAGDFVKFINNYNNINLRYRNRYCKWSRSR